MEAPPDLLNGGLRLGVSVIVLLCFLALTAGSGALDLARPAPIPTLLGQEKRDDRSLRGDAKVRDGSRMAVIDRDVTMRSNLGRHVVPWYASVMISVFREGTSSTLVGRDQWLFAADRLAPHGFDDEPRLAVLGANVIAAVVRNLEQCGLRVVVMPIPRKAVVAAKHLPPGLDSHAELDRRFMQELRERAVPAADLFEAWAGLEPAEVYYRWDTHWTRRGQLLAAEAVCAEAGVLAPLDRRRTRIDDVETMSPRHGQLLMLGIRAEHPAAQVFFPLETIPRLRLTDANGKKISPHEVSSAAGEWIAVGTSFTAGDQLTHYLSHAADTSFQNQGAAGEPPMRHLAEVLFDERSTRWPELVVLEYPIYSLFLGNSGAKLGKLEKEVVRLLTEATPARNSRVLPDGQIQEARKAAKHEFRLPAGALSTRGDGVVALRLAGSSVRRGARVFLQYGGLELTYRWRDSSEFVIPLVADAPGDGDLFAVVAGVSVDRIEIVTCYDLEAGRALLLDEVVGEPGAWRRDLRLERAATPARSAALWCVLDSEITLSPGAALELELLPEDPDEPVHGLGRFPVSAGTRLLVTIGDRPAGAWRGVRVRSTARDAARAVVEASLVEYHEPGR